MAGALLHRSPKGRLLLVGGGKGDWFSQQVRLGQRKALGSAIQEGDIRLVQKGWEGTEAFLADSQERTLGSRKKLRDLGRAGKVFLVGLGQDPDTCRAVLSGTQLATIYRSPLKLAEESAYLATKAARNAKTFDCQFADVPHEAGMVKTVLLTPKLLDRSNLLETLVKDGVYTKEQLEGKKP